MSVREINFKELAKIIEKCEGAIYITTEESDVINLKSKLSQMFGFCNLIEDGTIKIDDIKCEKTKDRVKITRYLLYGEI